MNEPVRQESFPERAQLRPAGVGEALRFARSWAAAAVGLPGDPQAVQVVGRRQGWGVLQYGRSIAQLPLTLAGRTFERGLGTHADSEIVVRAAQPIRRFRAWAGMDDNPGCRGGNTGSPERIVFALEAGGRELWRSRALGVASPPARVDVDARGTPELVLKAWDVSGSTNWAHADWAEAEVELADGTRVVLGAGAFVGQPVPTELPPFSFRYGGRDAAAQLTGWERRYAETPAGEGATLHRVTWRDPRTGLECELELQSFGDFPAAEWLLRFRNTGETDTLLLEDIRPLDTRWAAPGEACLRRSRGSPCTPADFQYLVEPLTPGATLAMAAGGGRSSNEWLPFFNLQSGAEGVIAAIGWTGQWAAEFTREADSIRLRAGQELTRLVLHAGEEIRTPRIVLLFWNGDPQAGHNLLRRFILAHHTPRPNGQLLRGPLTLAHWGGMKSAEHRARIEEYRRRDLGYEYYWVDAGWYGPTDSYSPDEFSGDWWKHVGNWTINPAAHPKGLRPISDAAGAAAMKFLLWFEPERALVGTPLPTEHPDWFLGERKPLANLLLDLGNPAAREWLTEFLSTFMTEQGVHLYRQDFNFDPLPYWRAADAPDRQGMAEIRHVEGLYRLWDDLLRRHPGLVIDNCASGGRRIDLETISRSIPLWRSDWQCGWTNDPTPGQTHAMGLSYWVPLSGTGVLGGSRRAGDTYNFRSSLSAAIQFAIYPYESFPIRDDYPWDWHQRMLADYRRARPLFYGDYYPLTPCNPAYDTWAVFQMHRPDLGEGLVIAFRREQSPFVSADFRLQALEVGANFELVDADSGRTWRQAGKDLLEHGLRLTMEKAPESRLVFYRRVT